MPRNVALKRILLIALVNILLPQGGLAADDSAQEERIRELERKVERLTDKERIEEVDAQADKERIEELERTVEVLTDEVEKSLIERVVPDVLESKYGLGPAASKVYHIDKGLSIGGYGEARYSNQVSDGNDDRFDFVRFVTYIGYKFNDTIILNTEIEFEHATTDKEGAVSVEFATLDFMLSDAANIRAGLVLIPMGFINEMHEPVTFFGAHRPEVERRIIPSTWRAGGGGLFGRLGDRVEYKLYAVNGFDATGFDNSGLRGGRQKGSKALAHDWGVVARLDVYPVGGLNLGGSVYHGNSGQNQKDPDIPQTPTTIWEIHTQYEKSGARFRGLFSMSFVGDAAELSAAKQVEDMMNGEDKAPISSQMLGGYAEVGYNLLPLIFPDTGQSLEPFYRFEYLDTQRDVMGFPPTPSSLKNRNQRIHTVGISYKPISQVVIKLDYRNRDADAPIADEVNIGLGFVF